MRAVLHPQLTLTEVDIGAIQFDMRSRDDVTKLLLGLQHIYTEPHVRAAVFEILKEIVPQDASGDGKASLTLGRPGMAQWRILVLGTLRLALGADYDRLVDLANYHVLIRQMLGHPGAIDELDPTTYTLQTLKDNLRLFTPELLARIDQVGVRAGHALIKKNAVRTFSDELNTRVDSFVVETDVHYPTDANLLLDAIRKIITLCARFSAEQEESGWRQYQYNILSFKRQCRTLSKLKRSNSQDETKRDAKQQQIQAAHREYLEKAEQYVARASATREQLEKAAQLTPALAVKLEELTGYLGHAARQIAQIRRRVLEGEVIPHEEKVFSIFEPHTEWIMKGKAGVPVELGIKVAIVEDQYRFILHHAVLEKTEDVEAALPLIEDTQAKHGTLASASFDKGFHSPENQTELKKLVPLVVLPKKGRLNAADREREGAEEFGRLRAQHSAVESAINALEHHGLDRCLDRGIEGFKRYVALAVFARNVLRIGQILHQQHHDERRRQRAPFKQAA